MPEYLLGIKAEADRLTALGYDVGEPLADEVPLHAVPGGTQTHAVQFSSQGVFWYDAASNKVWFLPGAGADR